MIEMNNEQYIVNTPWFILFKLIFSNFYLNLGDKLLFLGSDVKNIISYEKNFVC